GRLSDNPWRQLCRIIREGGDRGSAGGMDGCLRRHFRRPHSQVEPLPPAVRQGREPNPLQHPWLVPVDLEDRVGGRASQEMEAAGRVLPLEEETADAVTRHARQPVVGALQRKAEQVEQLLQAAGQMTTQPEQSLSVLAESIEGHVNRGAVGPKDFISFVTNVISLPIPGRCSPEKHCQSARFHAAASPLYRT